MPLILWLSPKSYTSTGTLYSAMAWYAGAKLYEFLDKDVFSFGQLVSGHTLKHIGAAVGCYMIFYLDTGPAAGRESGKDNTSIAPSLKL